MKKILIIAVMALAASGCSLMDLGPDSEPVQTTHRVITVVANSTAQAEPVLQGIEAAVGPAVTEGQQTKGVEVGGMVQTVANTGAAIANAIPGGQGVAVLLGALGTLAGAVTTMLGKRKTKAVAVAAVNAADALPGGGKALTEAAKTAGVGNVVDAVYKRQG